MSDNAKEEEASVGVKATHVVERVDDTDDVAGGFLARIAERDDADELLAPFTEEEERRLVRRKIDPIVMTLLQFAFMMAAVDKVCTGSAAVMGWRTDLHLVGQQYSWISSILYFGSIVAVFPMILNMQSWPAGRYFAANTAAWGIILMASAAAKNFTGIMIARFILGLFESIIFASSGIFVTMWWRRHEQPWRTAVIFSSLASVTNGLLAYACVRYKPGDIKQWQLLFLIVGLIKLLWSGATFALLPDSPTTAWWLTTREKVIAIRRTEENQTGMENKVLKKSQIIEAAIDPKTWFFFFINIALSIPNGGLIGFGSIIVASLGFSTPDTLLLAIPNGVISWLSSILFGFIAVKTKRRHATSMAACLVPLIGTVILHVVPRSNQSGSLAGLYILYCYWGPYTTARPWLHCACWTCGMTLLFRKQVAGIMYANTGGFSKKMATFGIGYIGYCVGNLLGPQIFRSSEAPKYPSAVAGMLACYCVAIVLLACLWAYTVVLNKKKALQLAEHEKAQGEFEDLIENWHDQTDFENPKFVYIT
ncbi:hypothetical protein JCM5296_000872 [Sporobolomyces johnsonii]